MTGGCGLEWGQARRAGESSGRGSSVCALSIDIYSYQKTPFLEAFWGRLRPCPPLPHLQYFSILETLAPDSISSAAPCHLSSATVPSSLSLDQWVTQVTQSHLKSSSSGRCPEPRPASELCSSPFLVSV